jgi:hypothetical protein
MQLIKKNKSIIRTSDLYRLSGGGSSSGGGFSSGGGSQNLQSVLSFGNETDYGIVLKNAGGDAVKIYLDSAGNVRVEGTLSAEGNIEAYSDIPAAGQSVWDTLGDHVDDTTIQYNEATRKLEVIGGTSYAFSNGITSALGAVKLGGQVTENADMWSTNGARLSLYSDFNSGEGLNRQSSYLEIDSWQQKLEYKYIPNENAPSEYRISTFKHDHDECRWYSARNYNTNASCEINMSTLGDIVFRQAGSFGGFNGAKYQLDNSARWGEINSSNMYIPHIGWIVDYVDNYAGSLDHDHSGVYEPIIAIKNTAFNKAFAGSGAATTVSRSDHNHTGTYEPAFSKGSAFNKNFSGSGSATTVSRSDHNHTGTYEPAFSKNSAFNKSFAGTGSATTVSRSNHDHFGVYESVFSKNTAFNKNFGGNGSAQTVSRSDHSHSSLVNNTANADVAIYTHNGSGLQPRILIDGDTNAIVFYNHDGVEVGRFDGNDFKVKGNLIAAAY